VIRLNILESQKWIELSSLAMDGVGFPSSDRANISVSLLHLSMEHQRGIHTLVDKRFDGSAFALLRPQFEAFVRGLWFSRCSKDTDVSKFISGKEPPRIKQLIDDIEKTDGYKNGALGRKKLKLWTYLNDLTHGGFFQVASRNSDGEIQGRYRDEHIDWLLTESISMSLLASIEIAKVANNQSLSNELVNLYDQCS